MEVVERAVAAVQQIVCNFRNALNSAGDVDANRMLLVQTAQHVEEYPPAGVVVAHADLLPDNALFLGNAFRREVRRLDKGEQDLQRSLEVVGAAEEIAGLVERGERVGVGTSLGVQVEHIAVLVLEQLVFQEVGDALRHGAVVLVRRGLELGVDRAVLCAEHGFGGAVALHFAD